MENQFPLKFKVNLIEVMDAEFYSEGFELEDGLFDVKSIWFNDSGVAHVVVETKDTVSTIFPEKVKFELFQMFSTNEEETIDEYVMVWTNSDRDYTGLDGEDYINLEVMN